MAHPRDRRGKIQLIAFAQIALVLSVVRSYDMETGSIGAKLRIDETGAPIACSHYSGQIRTVILWYGYRIDSLMRTLLFE